MVYSLVSQYVVIDSMHVDPFSPPNILIYGNNLHPKMMQFVPRCNSVVALLCNVMFLFFNQILFLF
jgi:hypothetical protein